VSRLTDIVISGIQSVHSYLSLFSGSFVRHSVTDTNCYELERSLSQPVFEQMLLTVFTTDL